jgi:predicted transcriptional regulator
METVDREKMLEFFKTLADRTRLDIIGHLAGKPSSVEDLADLLGLNASTVSHHLARLSGVGLVSAKAEGYYSIYSLHADTLAHTMGNLIMPVLLQKLPRQSGERSFEEKVLKTFTDSSGKIRAFPAKEKKYLVLLRHVMKSVDKSRRYTEKELSALLEGFNKDYSKLRRDLVEFGFMGREGGGCSYWAKEDPFLNGEGEGCGSEEH